MNATLGGANLLPGAILLPGANLHQGANCAYKRGFRQSLSKNLQKDRTLSAFWAGVICHWKGEVL